MWLCGGVALRCLRVRAVAVCARVSPVSRRAKGKRTPCVTGLLYVVLSCSRDSALGCVWSMRRGCWQVCEHAGAAEKGHSRVRHFPGLVAFPVVKRAARGVGRGSEARPARRTRRGFAGAACLGSVADGLLRMGARARASAAAACSAA